MTIKKLAAVSILLFIFISLTTSITMAEEVKRAPRFNFNTIEADKIIGQLGIFYPFANKESSLFYTDTRYRIDSDDIHEWNLGLGYRYKMKSGNKIGGIYLYKDRREEFNTNWDMWTIGGEIYTDKIDIRANVYIADDKRVENPSEDSLNIEDGKLIYQKSFYTSMDGIDFEIGKRWTKTGSIFNNIGVYGRVFKFVEDDIADMNGKEIRINKLYGDRNGLYSKFGIKWRDDNLRGQNTEATLSISLPFGKGKIKESKEKNIDKLEKRMTEQPVRDLDYLL